MDQTAITFRPITVNDLDAVRDMQARSFAALGGGANTAGQIQAHVDEIMSPAYREELLDNHLIVAEDPDGRPRTARIRKVFIAPERARQGLGRLLVEAAEADAAAHGLRDFACRANRNAAPFYERLGYRAERDGVMATSAGIDLPVVYMAKIPAR